MIDLDLKPDRKKLRSFAWISVAVFGSIAGLAFWKTGLDWRSYGAGAIAAYSLICAVATPSFIRPLYIGLTLLAFPIGWVVSNVVMTLLYYCLFFPIGLLKNLFSKDSMRRPFNDSSESFWNDCRKPKSLKDYYNQF